VLFGFGLFLLIVGAYLVSVEKCAFIFCQHPYLQLAEVCYVFGFILLASCVVTFIAALIIRFSS
jgi:hypothetical protein